MCDFTPWLLYPTQDSAPPGPGCCSVWLSSEHTRFLTSGAHPSTGELGGQGSQLPPGHSGSMQLQSQPSCLQGRGDLWWLGQGLGSTLTPDLSSLCWGQRFALCPPLWDALSGLCPPDLDSWCFMGIFRVQEILFFLKDLDLAVDLLAPKSSGYLLFCFVRLLFKGCFESHSWAMASWLLISSVLTLKLHCLCFGLGRNGSLARHKFTEIKNALGYRQSQYIKGIL